MAVLGIAALLLVFYGAVMCAVSGRKLYLSLIVWSLPVFFFVFGVENEGIDGFVILIWLIFSAETMGEDIDRILTAYRSVDYGA